MNLRTAAAALVLGLAAAPGFAESISGADYLAAPDGLMHSDFVLGPTTPGKWGAPVMGTPGGVVTWSLMPSGVTLTGDGGGLSVALSSFMPAGFHAALVAAFAAWSAVANIQFVEVADSGLFNAPGATGDIRFCGHAFDGPGGTLAHGFFPPVNGVSAAGDIHFDSSENWVLGFGLGGFSIFQVAAHEIGHAIGLDHTAVPNSLMNAFYSEAFSGPQADDIAGAQFIYGAAVAPEPATFALVGAGFVLMIGVRRARRRRVAA